MFTLETQRLLIVQTPLTLIETRLQHAGFSSDLPTAAGTLHVHFPAEWPGDALVIFPVMAEQLRSAPDTLPWGGVMLDRTARVAVGQISFKGLPDASGTLEVGYGVNPSFQGRGYASEATRALTEWALARPDVRRVSAECLDSNAGSVRVLERAGFSRVGERSDAEEGGTLVLWERTV
ncbi:GNAT family N-acetyltransferase [Deinococcus sp.]|uniref:GNAT family N-acetyltransferase n=1 Tax=Deinococcus sp. TaxID=47478 RepID=UPI003C79A495